MQEAVLVAALIAHHPPEIREVLSHHAPGGHLVLDVGHVDSLVGLRVADHMLWHDLHHALVNGGVELPRVHVEVVVLLDKAAGTRPSRERGEVRGVHACRISGEHTAPVPVEEVSDPVREGVQFVHARIAEEAKCLNEEAGIFKFFACLQNERLRLQVVEESHAIFEQAKSTTNEGHIADAEAAALRKGDVVGPILEDGIEVIGVLELSKLVHRLEHVQQEPSRCGDRPLVAEPARRTWACKALPPGNEVDLRGTVFAAAANVLNGECTVSDDRSAGVLHLAIIPDELAPLTVVALAVTDRAAEGALTGVVDDAVDVVCSRIVVDDGGIVGLGGALILAEILDAQLVVAVVRILFADNLKADDIAVEVRILVNAILTAGVVHCAEHLQADRMVVHAGARTGLALERAGGGCSQSLEGLRKDVSALGRPRANCSEALVACPDILMPKPNVECAEVGLDFGVLRCRVVPSITTALRVTVKEDNVEVAVNTVLHGRLDPLEATTDNRRDVRPRVVGVPEVLQSSDEQLRPNIGVILDFGLVFGVQHGDFCFIPPVGENAEDGLLQHLHLRPRLNRDLDMFVGALHGETCQVVRGSRLPL
mmetsp:Transcript_20781/g.64929  ORF Transcript_20781/g.64929 Transcript_20781/m.64929 type:complete len:596 (+) Transcript_20781:719-2506(+)